MNQIKSTLRTMGRPLAAFSLALAAATPAMLVAPTVAQAQASDVDRAVAALRGVTTLRANFVQTDRSGQTVSGVLTMKRPGKIRFQYQKGVPLLIVGDGRALTMIDYEVRQVQRWPIKNSPLGALLDPNKDVARFAKQLPTGDAGVISLQVRDPKHPEYGTITMIFVRNAGAPGGLQLDSWVALDSQNKRTTVRLSGHQYGIAVNDSTFRWTDPRRPVTR
ncbi:LolA family protein [Novosphingobium taihuense]|uniref:Outer membrane lipoprotein-sorting protein n=1 Tax=Novosphingobium taihuense TaxID=260085 RepID=A0A7W7EW47_9SPHN|nr:outer membrane lipoprotein carrier protein LolA [Novosphingobium taihuense]MBB4615709.1 outer membrane lipoprotein-sorting protein [Novosphingobium taihuense]TWH80122.1 outer membrane lipoprotein-sorting protein [Novosphingobium taihuense]